MAIIGQLWIAIFDIIGQKCQIMTKFFFLKNTTYNGGSIKNPMNPERKTKLYTAKKISFSYIAYIESIKVEKSSIISPQMK